MKGGVAKPLPGVVHRCGWSEEPPWLKAPRTWRMVERKGSVDRLAVLSSVGGEPEASCQVVVLDGVVLGLPEAVERCVAVGVDVVGRSYR